MDELTRMADEKLADLLLAEAHRSGQSFVSFSPLKPGELIRHQDGGIYRFVGYARSTEDTALRMLYDHVWPFGPTDIPWDRPASEWGSRFTRISEQDLADAMQQDRAQAQQAVIAAKAARRANAAAKTLEAAAAERHLAANYNEVVATRAGAGMSYVATFDGEQQ